MKKRSIILMVLIAALGTSNVSAQSWLSKALKKVDKTLDSVDKILGEPSNSDVAHEDETTPQEKYHYVPAFQNIEGTTTKKDMVVRFISCIRNDREIEVEFEITNNSEYDIDLTGLGAIISQTPTAISDNTGNNHRIAGAEIGGKSPMRGDLDVTRFPIFSETKIIGKILLTTVSKSATSLPLFRIGFKDNSNNAHDSFQFKKVPIINIADINKLEEQYKQSVSAKE